MSPGAVFLAGVAAGAAAAALAARRAERLRTEELGRLLSFAAHEINTPVTAVNMTVMNLLSGVFGELPEAQRPWVELAREQMSRLNGLVGELRDYVHLDLRREFRPIIESVRPEALVEQALVGLRRGFEQAGAQVEVAVPEGLPAVSTDADRAARSLASMLFHARKFRRGGPVRIAAAAAGGGVAFTVDYAGPKISPEEAKASLEPEYPGRRRASQTLAATGLGLGVVRVVMEPAGGTLDYAVAPDGASRITLTLAGAR